MKKTKTLVSVILAVVMIFTLAACTVTGNEDLCADGHNYVNGVCKECGASEPVQPVATEMDITTAGSVDISDSIKRVVVSTVGGNVTLNGGNLDELVIGAEVGDGDVTLNNVNAKVVKVYGGGSNSIHIKGSSKVANISVKREGSAVRIVTEDNASVEIVVIDDGCDDVILTGSFDNVQVDAAETTVKLENVEVETLTVNAGSGTVEVSAESSVTNLELSEKAEEAMVNIEGTVENVNINAPKSTVEVGGEVKNLEINAAADQTKVVATEKEAKIENIVTSAPNTVVSGEGNVGAVKAKEGANNTKVDTSNTIVNAEEGVTGVTAGGKEVKPNEGGKPKQNDEKQPAATRESIDVSTLAQLLDAVKNEKIRIVVSADITVSADAGVVIETGKDVILDLSGHTITRNVQSTAGDGRGVFVVNGGKLTIYDSTNLKLGKIIATDATKFAQCIVCNSGEVVINGGNFQSDYALIYVYGNTDFDTWTTAINSSVTINNGNFECSAYGLVAQGNGAILNINGGNVETAYMAVSGNGTNTAARGNRGGTIINITGGVLTSTTDAAMYFPQFGTVNVSGGTITGTEAIIVKDGILNITGGTFVANGAYYDPATANNDGTESTGACISISSNPAYTTTGEGYMQISISGGSFTSDNGHAFYEGIAYKNGSPISTTAFINKISITGGTFASADTLDNIMIKTALTSTDENADISVAQSVRDNYSVKLATTVTTEAQFINALRVATVGARITVNADITLTADKTVGEGVAVVVAAGKTLTVDTGITLTNKGIIETKSTATLAGNVVNSDNGETCFEAATFAELRSVVDYAPENSNIKLVADLTHDTYDWSQHDFAISSQNKNQKFTLDLNGHILGCEVDLRAGSSSTHAYDNAIDVTIINSVPATGYIGNGTTEQNDYGILMCGEGEMKVTLEGVKSYGIDGGIYSNGIYHNLDTKVNAKNCEFYGINVTDSAGAYLVSQFTYEFEACTFSALTGLHTKSGNYTFTDCTITGTGTYSGIEYNGNGGTACGSALVCECTSGGYGQYLNVTINGGTFNSTNGYAIEQGHTGSLTGAYEGAVIKLVGDITFNADNQTPKYVSGDDIIDVSLATIG